MTSTSIFRFVELSAAVMSNIAVLYFSILAYRRTKLGALAVWIASSAFAIILVSAWYIGSCMPPPHDSGYMTFLMIYRVGFVVIQLLGAMGSIMMIRHILAKLEKKDDDAA